MQPIVRDIRQELTEAGIEFTAADLDEILNVGAALASCLGGYVFFDCGEHWGIELALDPDDPEKQRCDVMVIYFDEDDDSDDAGFPEEELLN